MGLGQRIKDAVTPGRHSERNNVDTPYYPTGTSAPGDVPAADTEGCGTTAGATPLAASAEGTAMGAGAGSGLGATGTHPHHAHVAERTGMAAERVERDVAPEVCGQQTFVQVEDRPIVKERVERVVEHRPVEKHYVQETRFVGEQAIPSAGGETSLGVTERVIEAAQPGPTCPNPNAPVQTVEGERIGHVSGNRTMDI